MLIEEGILENTWLNIGICIVILISGLLLRKYLSQAMTWFAYRLLKNYADGQIGFNRFMQLLRRPFSLFIIIVTLYFALDRLTFPEYWHVAPIEDNGVRKFLMKLFQTSIILSFTWILLRLTDFAGIVLLYKANLTESKSDDQIIPFVKEAIKIVLATFSVFFILGFVYHLNITSLIAGLGIGGIAIALAAKETLENLIGSVTIFFDKPFVMGDLVKVGNIEGNIEKIGFRSTRIRTLEKSFVTVPNKKMVDSEVENQTLRSIRRIKFDFQVPYSTPTDKLKKLTGDVREFIKNHRQNFDEPQVFVYLLSTYSISIRVIYFVNTNEWEEYMEIREDVNYYLLNYLKEHGLEIAIPVQEIRVEETDRNL